MVANVHLALYEKKRFYICYQEQETKLNWSRSGSFVYGKENIKIGEIALGAPVEAEIFQIQFH